MSETGDRAAGRVATRAPGAVPRLISRLYRCARPAAKAAMLAVLTRPLGSLGLAAVASGAFAGLVARRGRAGVEVGLDETARITSEQVLELSHFVEQVDPGVFQQLAIDIVSSPAGFTAYGVAVASLILRWYEGLDRADSGHRSAG